MIGCVLFVRRSHEMDRAERESGDSPIEEGPALGGSGKCRMMRKRKKEKERERCKENTKGQEEKNKTKTTNHNDKLQKS